MIGDTSNQNILKYMIHIADFSFACRTVHQVFAHTCLSLDTCTERADSLTSVLSHFMKADSRHHRVFFSYCQPLDSLQCGLFCLVRKTSACGSCQIFAQVFVATFKQLNGLLYAIYLGSCDVIGPTSQEIGPVFAGASS